MCWRLLDAQHWADPRLARRQRVFVVADFGGRRAGAVLFKPRRLFPAPASCGDFGLPPAGGNRISASETGGPLPVVHPFQGYRMRGAAKAGDVGNFLGSFGKPSGRRWRSRPTSITSSTCLTGGRIRPRSDSDGAADRSLWTRCPEASGGFGVQPQQAFLQGENGECIDTRPACQECAPLKWREKRSRMSSVVFSMIYRFGES